MSPFSAHHLNACEKKRPPTFHSSVKRPSPAPQKKKPVNILGAKNRITRIYHTGDNTHVIVERQTHFGSISNRSSCRASLKSHPVFNLKIIFLGKEVSLQRCTQCLRLKIPKTKRKKNSLFTASRYMSKVHLKD